MNLRQELEAREERFLSPFAFKSVQSRGRARKEPECDLRPAFQHDRDRILYSKAFRRLKHKTQVFLSPSGDHYRTRLTHTLEVSQIARTLARGIGLNEDLTEAIALGHDLGHTPFGHAGESILNSLLPGGFRHHQQSLRVVDELEKDGQGLNLTYEVRMGILWHSKGRGSILLGPEEAPEDLSLEAHVVRVADLMAYVAHDTDDAIRGGVISVDDLPQLVVTVLGNRISRQINTMIRDFISMTRAQKAPKVAMSDHVLEGMYCLREFLWDNVYDNLEVHSDFMRASKVIEELFSKLVDDDNFCLEHLGGLPRGEERMRRAADYIAGMTDRYALKLYEDTFLPKPWARL